MATKKIRFSIRENKYAVQIPQEFQLGGGKIKIQPCGNTPLFRHKKLSWAPLMDSLKKFLEDFMPQGRPQHAFQMRKRPFA